MGLSNVSGTITAVFKINNEQNLEQILAFMKTWEDYTKTEVVIKKGRKQVKLSDIVKGE